MCGYFIIKDWTHAFLKDNVERDNVVRERALRVKSHAWPGLFCLRLCLEMFSFERLCFERLCFEKRCFESCVLRGFSLTDSSWCVLFKAWHHCSNSFFAIIIICLPTCSFRFSPIGLCWRWTIHRSSQGPRAALNTLSFFPRFAIFMVDFK